MAVFGIDTKKHLKQHEDVDGNLKQFSACLGVAVNPPDLNEFDEVYYKTMEELFSQFTLPHNRDVYKSYEIGRLCGNDVSKFGNFCLGFTRKILSIDDLKVTYFFTTLNTSHLQDGKVIVYGEYGAPTERVDVKEFMNKMLPEYYEIVCAWKLIKKTRLWRATFYIDGVDEFYPTKAYQELTRENNLKIIYHGDATNPLISTQIYYSKTSIFF